MGTALEYYMKDIFCGAISKASIIEKEKVSHGKISGIKIISSNRYIARVK